MTVSRTFFFVFLASSTLIACDDAPSGPPPCEEIPESAYYGNGSHSVGSIFVEFYDDSRPTMANDTYEGDPGGRALPTTVYYPATMSGEGAPLASGGPFPVVLYSHGFSSSGGEGLYVYRQLASRGYVVIAPTFPLSNLGAPGGPNGADVVNQPGDQRFLLDALIARSEDSGDPLAGAIDSSRIAAVGLSLGGMTTLLLTYHPTLGDPRVNMAVAIAPASAIFGDNYFNGAAAPLTLISGDSDAIVEHETNAALTFERAHSPSTLVTIRDGSHTGFASYATLFDRFTHTDEAGCAALDRDGGATNDTWGALLDELGGEAAGIINPGPTTSCAIDPLPPSVCATRQLSVTAELVQAALDATLADSADERADAAAFLASSRRRHGELRVRSK